MCLAVFCQFLGTRHYWKGIVEWLLFGGTVRKQHENAYSLAHWLTLHDPVFIISYIINNSTVTVVRHHAVYFQFLHKMIPTSLASALIGGFKPKKHPLYLNSFVLALLLAV